MVVTHNDVSTKSPDRAGEPVSLAMHGRELLIDAGLVQTADAVGKLDPLITALSLRWFSAESGRGVVSVNEAVGHLTGVFGIDADAAAIRMSDCLRAGMVSYDERGQRFFIHKQQRLLDALGMGRQTAVVSDFASVKAARAWLRGLGV